MKIYNCQCGKKISVPDDVVALVDAAGSPMCESCFDDYRAKAAVNAKPEPEFVPYRGKYQWKDGMGEITGFGGGYEQAARNMFAAGCEWLDQHPDADIKFKESPAIFGMVDDTTTEDTKTLSEVIGKAVPGCTGAMHHAAVRHVLYVKCHGWEAYCREMSLPDAEG